MKTIGLGLLLMVLAMVSNGQRWVNLARESNAKGEVPMGFYKVQEAFDAYWQGKPIEKGKGWKPFKRAEQFLLPRVYPTGKLPYGKLLAAHSALKKEAGVTPTYWHAVGPNRPLTSLRHDELNGSGRLNCVAFHPVNKDVIWVGAPSGGLWKTTDGGASWVTTTDNLLSIGVSDIVVSPYNPDHIYIATGDRDAYPPSTNSTGVYKSLDGGLSWKSTSEVLSLNQEYLITRLLMLGEDTLLITTSNGIYRSTDDGASWDVVVKQIYFKDAEVHPTDPRVIYAANYQASRPGVYVSDDGGQTFSQQLFFGLSEAGRIELAVSPAAPDVIYALVSNPYTDAFQGLYKSTEKGKYLSWYFHETAKNLLGWEPDGSDKDGQGFYDLALAVSPTNANEVYVGGVNIWKSENSGYVWELESYWQHGEKVDYVHADHHALAFHPTTGLLFSCNDGGISKRSESGEWSDISGNMSILQIYKLGETGSLENYLITGNQDVGTMLYNDTSWNVVLGGDGMDCAVDPANPQRLYAEYYFGDLLRSDDGGFSFEGIKPETADTASWLAPLCLDPYNSNTLFIGYERVYKSINRGADWFALPAYTPNGKFVDGESIDVMAIAPTASELMLVGVNRALYGATSTQKISSLFVTNNGGQAWSAVGSGLPDRYMADAVFSDANPNRVYLCFSGFSYNDASAESVWMSVDGGQTWRDYSEGLPDVPVNCITYQHESDDAVYIGTDIGVFYRNNSMEEWLYYSEGLPSVVVKDIEIQYLENGNSNLLAATFGRGVWKAGTLPNAEFGTSTTSALVGREVVFYDSSYIDVDYYYWDFGDGAEPAMATGPGPHRVVYRSLGDKEVVLKVKWKSATDVRVKQGVSIRANNTLDVYPNPVSASGAGGVSLKFLSDSYGAVQYELVSLVGKVMRQASFNKELDLLEKPLNLSGLEQGVYAVRLLQDHKAVQKLIVIED